jgi:FMN phosphatase YigB (HAD superfamily)
MSAVASFDVFDTLLTRAVGSPEAVFTLLGRRLYRAGLISLSAEAFGRARVAAEGRAHQNRGEGCTLTAIYEELGSALDLSVAEQRNLLERECALEMELIRLIPDAPERLSRARATGRRVVFLSDFYLPATFIQRALDRHGLWLAGDACYVSCECGTSKRSGGLFAELVRREGVAAHMVTHQGNNPDDDGRSARRHGLHVVPFLGANPNRYEAALETFSSATEGLASALAGASRASRLREPATTPNEEALRDVAAGVMSPTLVGYALWILHRAQQLGLKRLYFLARDGQIVLAIARRLAARLGLACDLRYLHASRQAWNLPAMESGSREDLNWIWDSTDRLTVTSLLARVALEPDQLREPLIAAGLPASAWTRSLSAAERLALRQVLESARARELVVAQAGRRRRTTTAYLEQEGLLDPGPWGIADLGWYGSLQNSLATLVSGMGGSEPVGFYFALYKGDVAGRRSLHREAYYFDEPNGVGYLGGIPNLIALMEMLCTADHGTVVDYSDEGSEIRPVLKTAANQGAIDWGLPVLRRTVDRFVDELLLDPDLVNPWADVREAITSVLGRFWLRPTRSEAAAWAAFPWEDGLGAETYWNPLARPYGWPDVVRTIGRGRFEPYHRAAWHEGSLALARPSVRRAMELSIRGLRTIRVTRARIARRSHRRRNR